MVFLSVQSEQRCLADLTTGPKRGSARAARQAAGVMAGGLAGLRRICQVAGYE
jgi:hypothetical protein